jgi:hypothetical protein
MARRACARSQSCPPPGCRPDPLLRGPNERIWLVPPFSNLESSMAAYAALAFLSFLWGSSFLLAKIASRAFDPLGFALARVGVAAAAMLLASALSGKVWPGSRPGLWLNLVALALIGQVVPFILLGKAATLTTSADMAARPTAGRGSAPLAWRSASRASASLSGRRERKAPPIPSSGGLSPSARAYSMERARSSPAPRRGRSAPCGR